MLEHRDQIREAFVECVTIRIALLVETGMNAVEQRVRCLVGDDVMRQAREYGGPGRVILILGKHREIAEQQGFLGGAVIGILVAQGMRINAQPANEFAPPLFGRTLLRSLPSWRPQGHPAERALEVADGGHRDRIDHLLVELRIAFGRCQSILGKEIWIVEIDRRIDDVAGRIDTDYLDVFPNRSGRQRPSVGPTLPRNANNDFLDGCRLRPLRKTGIEGEYAEPARTWNLDVRRQHALPLTTTASIVFDTAPDVKYR